MNTIRLPKKVKSSVLFSCRNYDEENFLDDAKLFTSENLSHEYLTYIRKMRFGFLQELDPEKAVGRLQSASEIERRPWRDGEDLKEYWSEVMKCGMYHPDVQKLYTYLRIEKDDDGRYSQHEVVDLGVDDTNLRELYEKNINERWTTLRCLFEDMRSAGPFIGGSKEDRKDAWNKLFDKLVTFVTYEDTPITLSKAREMFGICENGLAWVYFPNKKNLCGYCEAEDEMGVDEQGLGEVECDFLIGRNKEV